MKVESGWLVHVCSSRHDLYQNMLIKDVMLFLSFGVNYTAVNLYPEGFEERQGYRVHTGPMMPMMNYFHVARW